jgi:hypothetical protein
MNKKCPEPVRNHLPSGHWRGWKKRASHADSGGFYPKKLTSVFEKAGAWKKVVNF